MVLRKLLALAALMVGFSCAAQTSNGLSGLAAVRPVQTVAQKHIIEVLNQEIPSFDFPKGDLGGTLSAISRSMGIPIIVEPDVSGTIAFQISGLTLRQLLTAACSANGVFFYVHPDGYVVVRARIARIYPIDFLASERKVTTTNTMSMLSSTNGGNSSGSSGTNGISSGVGSVGVGSASGMGGSGGLPGSQVSVAASNDDKFWDTFEADVKAFVKEKEVLRINRTAGIMYADAGVQTHAAIQGYWRSAMSRVNRGVTVHVYVLDCRYNNADQLGFDWGADAFRLGGIFGDAVRLGSSMTPASTGIATSGLNSTLNTITAVGGAQLGAPTFSGTVGIGKVRAFVSALQTQSTVRTETAPSIGLLNNRSSVVQVSDDKNFFSRTEDTIINDGSVSGGTVSGVTTTPITRRKFQIAQYSFGLFMPVTVQVSDQGVITLDINPTLTDFSGVDVSQDGLLTAPQKTTHTFSTQVQLRSGEAYVMGGYKRAMKGDQMTGTPGLSKIPLIGRMFRNEATVSQRGELVVVVEAVLKDIPMPEPIEVYTPNPAETVRPDLMLSLTAPEEPKAPVQIIPIAPAVQSQMPMAAAASTELEQKPKSTSMLLDIK